MLLQLFQSVWYVHIRLKLLPAFDMAYVAMSRRSYFTKPLSAESESQLQTMSLSQLQIERSVLESIKTKLLKKQEALEKRDRETQAAMKEEYEEYEKSLKEYRLKRQSNRLKEPSSRAIAFSKQMKDRHEMIAQDNYLEPSLAMTYSFEDLETLTSLNRTYEPPVNMQSLICEFQHVLLVDEIIAKRISKPGESDSSKSIWSPGAEAIASHHRGLAKAKVDMLLAKAKVRSLRRQ